MKKLTILAFCIFILPFLIAPSTAKIKKSLSPINVRNNPKTTLKPKFKIKTSITSPNKTRKVFLQDIGHQESGNRYNIVNQFGYMGKYQFGIKTLRGLGFKISKEKFLMSPNIQEVAMLKLLKTNKRYLQKYINNFEGKRVNGVLVTESGLLAAAHLGGAGSVKKWFKTGKVREDGNGVKITTYMEKFSGYKLNL